MEWANKISEALDVMVDELLPVKGMTVAEVLYTAAAGSFLDNPMREPVDQTPVQIPDDPRFNIADRFIVLSSGVGHELRYPEGTMIVCAKFHAAGERLKSGSWYVIQNTVGGLHEISARQFMKNGRGNFYLPTDDDKFEKKLHNSQSIKVIGLVTQRIMNE